MLSAGFQMHLASHFIPCNCKVNISFERAAWEESNLVPTFCCSAGISAILEKNAIPEGNKL